MYNTPRQSCVDRVDAFIIYLDLAKYFDYFSLFFFVVVREQIFQLKNVRGDDELRPIKNYNRYEFMRVVFILMKRGKRARE